MKFSNYCSDMVMDVVTTGSQNRSCWHWWAECHVERQALPSKWETRLTRMQFNPNTCIFISIKDFQTHCPPHIDSRKLSPAACHTIWTRYPLCDSTSSCKRIKWMRMSQTSQAATGTCKSKSKSDGSPRFVWWWCCHSDSMAVHNPHHHPPSTLNYFSDSCRRHTWLTGFNMASITLSGRDCSMWCLDYCVININCPVRDVTSLIFRTS